MGQLPKPIRDEPVRRIENGEPGKELADWLNDLRKLTEQSEDLAGLPPRTLDRESAAEQPTVRPNPTKSGQIKPIKPKCWKVPSRSPVPSLLLTGAVIPPQTGAHEKCRTDDRTGNGPAQGALGAQADPSSISDAHSVGGL